jgi:hypothetical protein
MTSGLRRARQLGVWLFLVLALLAGAERRVAEAVIDAVPSGTSLLSTDSVDGEEMRVRLIVVAETFVPRVETPQILITESVPPRVRERILPFGARGRSSRAPPFSASSTSTSRLDFDM